MITPNDACFIAVRYAPEGVEFSGDCVDYRGCYVFPYAKPGSSMSSSYKRLFVDKETGTPIPGDPNFNVELWNKSDNLKDEVSWKNLPGMREVARVFKPTSGQEGEHAS